MSRFVNRQATDEITLANGDKVTVRQRLTAAENAELKHNLIRFRMNADTGEFKSEEGDWHLSKINICKAYVVGWTFTDDAGQLVPVSDQAIDSLDDETVGDLAGAIDRLQAQHREQRQKKV